IGKTDVDSEAGDGTVTNGIDEVTEVIRTYSCGGYGQRIGAPAHFQRNLRIHAWIESFLRVGQVDFGAHIARLWIETQREAGHRPDEGLALEAVWLDDRRIADAEMRHSVLRHIADDPERIDRLDRGQRIPHSGDAYRRERVTRLHVIADINPNIGQVAGDLSEEIGHLEGFKRGVGLQPLYHGGTARMLNLDPRTRIHLR